MLKILVIIFVVHKCCGVIYHLNDSEYERMPALYGLDPYEQCLRHRGLYCLVRYDLHGDPNNELMTMIQKYSELTTKHYNHSYIERGVCVTKTCKQFYDDPSVGDLSTVLGACMNDSIKKEYGLEVKSSFIYYCDEEPVHKTDYLDWLVAVLFGSLGIMAVVGSVYDLVFNRKLDEAYNGKGNQYLLSFSIRKNWKDLTSKSKNEDFKMFYGFKCIETFFVIFGHLMLTAGSGFIANPHEFEKNYETALYQLVFNGMAIVQVFFLMSGFLLTYNLQKSSERMDITWAMIPKIVFYRWCRLTPAYAAILAFSMTWLRHLGSGPVWNLFVGGPVAACRKHWLLHLLYIQNYNPDERFCALHTWYLATEMQLLIMGLMVYMLTLAKGRIAPLIAVISLGMLAPALHVIFQDLDGVMLMTPETYRTIQNDTFSLVHIRGHNNVPCYFIGMLTAYLVHRWQKRGFVVRTNKVIRLTCWCVIPCIVGLMLAGRGFYEVPRASLPARALYAGTHRAVLGLLVAYKTVSMIMKWEEYQKAIFEWDGWVLPSRLSYSVFLLHMNVVHVLLGAKMQLAHFSPFILIINQLGVFILTYLLAVPFYLVVESPLAKLLNVFLMKTTYIKTQKKQ